MDSKKNRGQLNGCATDCWHAQPDRSARTNGKRTKDGYGEHREVNDAVENVRGVIDKLKRFLNSGAYLAGDRDHECGRADEDDRVDRRFVARMQTREPTRKQMVPTCDHWQSRAAGYMNAGRRDRADGH